MLSQSHLIPAWQRRLDVARANVAKYKQRLDTASPGTSHLRIDTWQRELERWRKTARALEQKIGENQS